MSAIRKPVSMTILLAIVDWSYVLNMFQAVSHSVLRTNLWDGHVILTLRNGKPKWRDVKNLLKLTQEWWTQGSKPFGLILLMWWCDFWPAVGMSTGLLVELTRLNLLSQSRPTLFLFFREGKLGAGSGEQCAGDSVTISVSHLPFLFPSGSSCRASLGWSLYEKLSQGQVHLIGLVQFRGRSDLPLTCFISFLWAEISG